MKKIITILFFLPLSILAQVSQKSITTDTVCVHVFEQKTLMTAPSKIYGCLVNHGTQPCPLSLPTESTYEECGKCTLRKSETGLNGKFTQRF